MADDLEKKLAAGMKAMDEGDFKKAYSTYKKLCAENPDIAECWFYKAECGNFASGMGEAKVKEEEIIEAYNKAIELDPQCDYLEAYGHFCISINKYEEAEHAFCEAATNPEHRAFTQSSQQSTSTRSSDSTESFSTAIPTPLTNSRRKLSSTCSKHSISRPKKPRIFSERHMRPREGTLPSF